MKRLLATLILVLPPTLAWCAVDDNDAIHPPPPPMSSAPDARPPANAEGDPMARLWTALALAPEQLGAWRGFEDTINAYMALHLREKPPAALAEEKALVRMRHLVDTQQNRLAALEDIEEAAKRLYQSLDARQKKVADQWMIDAVPTFQAPKTDAPSPAEGGRDRGRRGDGGGPPGGGFGGGMGGGMGGRGF